MSIEVPDEQLVTDQPVQTHLDSSAFSRPLKVDISRPLEQLGVGLEDLAMPLAKQQGEKDAAEAVSRDPAGAFSIVDHPNQLILGRAGRAYQDATISALSAASRSDIDVHMSQIATLHANDPQGFQAAAGGYIDTFKGRTDPLGASMLLYARAIAAQHQINLGAQKQRADLAANGSVIDSRVEQLENQMDGLAAQGASGSSAFIAAEKERASLIANKIANPAFGYNQQLADVANSNLKTRLDVATLTGFARSEVARTGNVQEVLKNVEAGLDKLPISQKDKLSYEGEITRHLYSLAALGAQQRQEMGDKADTMAVQFRSRPDSMQPQDLDTMSLQLERQRMFAKSAELQSAKIYGQVIAPKIISGSVQDAVEGLHAVQSMAAGGLAPGASGRGLINAPYTRPVDQPTSSGLSPQMLYSYLLANGASKKQALLLTGAAGSEGVYNPQAVHDGGIGYGLFGHNGQRLAAMRADAGSFTPDWQHQALFALKELRSRPEGAAANAATGSDQLADAQMAYEQPRAYTAANPRAGENYTGRLNTLEYLAQNLKDAPSLGPRAAGSVQDAGPLAVRYSVALKEAQTAYNTKASQLWAGMEQAYANKQMPTSVEVAQLNAMLPDVTDAALRQKIGERTALATASENFQALPIAQKQDLANTASILGQQGQLGRLERQLVAPMQEHVERQMKLAAEDPVSLGMLKTPPRVAQDAKLPALQALDPSNADQYVAGLRARQLWKSIAKSSDSAVGDMPLRAPDIKLFARQAPQWTGDQTAVALGGMGSTLTGPEQDALMANKDFKESIVGMARSGDYGKMNAAFSFLDLQKRRNPILFAARNDDVDKDLSVWQSMVGYLPPDEVAKRMTAYYDPAQVKARDALGEVAKEALKGVDADSVVSNLFGSYIPFMSPGQIASPGAGVDEAGNGGAILAQDYRKAYIEHFKDTASKDAAQKYAERIISNKYSVSEFNGGRVMARAPDRTESRDGATVGTYYPMINGSHDWLRAQLAHDVTQSEFFSNLRHTDPKQANDLVRQRGRGLALWPDEKTEADISSGRPPSYKVLAMVGGRYTVVESSPGRVMRFRGDPSDPMRDADAANAAEQARARESESDLPMFGD